MEVIRLDLPDDELGAAAVFHAGTAHRVEEAIARGAQAVCLVLPPAGYEQGDWRRAAARGLARRAAPARVNMVAGEPGPALEATLAYLAAAPGVTGQYLECAR